MTLGEQRQQDAEKASRAFPEMVEKLRLGESLVEITQHLADKYEVEPTKAARWVQFVSQSFEKQRRRIAVAGSALIWLGAVSSGIGGVFSLLGVTIPALVSGVLPGYVVFLVLGVLLIGVGLWLGFSAPRLAKVSEETLTG